MMPSVRKHSIFHFGSSNPFAGPDHPTGKQREESLKKDAEREQLAAKKPSGLTIPGYNYLGPGNSLDSGPPLNSLDELAKTHDEGYQKILDSGHNPYTHWSKTDQDFLDGIHKEDLSVGKVVAGGLFGLKKALAPVLAPGHDPTNLAPPPAKRPATGMSSTEGHNLTDSSTSGETMQTSTYDSSETSSTGSSASGAGAAGLVSSGGTGEVGGGPAGVSKPPLKNGYSWNGKYLTVWQTRRFYCMNTRALTESPMVFFKGVYEAKGEDLTSQTVDGSESSSTTTATTPTNTSSSSTATQTSTSPPTTAPTSANATVSNATASASNVTTNATESTSTNGFIKLCNLSLSNTDGTEFTAVTTIPCFANGECNSSSVYTSSPSRKRKNYDAIVYSSCTTPLYAEISPDASKRRRLDQSCSSYRAPAAVGSHHGLYSCMYDWHYVDANRQIGLMQPSVRQHLHRSCVAWRPVHWQQSYFGLQCVNEVEVGATKTQNLMPYSAIQCAIRSRDQIPWVCNGRRAEKQINSNEWKAVYHWPESPVQGPILPMRQLHLQSSLYTVGSTASNNTRCMWNVPVMEHGEIMFMTQTDCITVGSHLNSTWVSQDTYFPHVLDLGVNYEILSSQCCSEVMSLRNKANTCIPRPFTTSHTTAGMSTFARLSKIYSQQEKNTMRFDNEILTTQGKTPDRNPKFPGHFAFSTAETRVSNYGLGVASDAAYRSQEDFGDRRGIVRHNRTRVTAELDVPVFTPAPAHGKVNAANPGGSIVHGEIPPQVFFRCEACVGPSGGETKMMCNMYVTTTVTYETKPFECGRGYGGYTMPDIGIGGINLTASCNAQNVVMLDQALDPWTAGNAWETGPVHQL
nr:MAG: VP1 [Ecsensius stictus parvovirus]